jgi:hypothetical protein
LPVLDSYGVDEQVQDQHDELLDAGNNATQYLISKGGPLWVALEETVQLRDKVLERRIGMEISESNFNAQWKHTSGHLDNFLVAATELMNSLSPDYLRSHGMHVQERWARMQQSASHLQKWQKEGLTKIRDLTKLEGKLAEKEEHLYEKFRQLISGPNDSESLESETAYTVNYDRLSDSTDRTDPLERDYYDKVGDMLLIQEHIFNTDADQKRRVYQREMAMRTGEFVTSTADRESYEQYSKDRRLLINEYLTAKTEMELLRNSCHKIGLKVEPPNSPPFLDLSQRIERSPSPYSQGSSPKISKRWNPDAYLLFGGLDKQNRILLWRHNVRQAQQAPFLLCRDQETSRSRSPSLGRGGGQHTLSPLSSRSYEYEDTTSSPTPPPPPPPLPLVLTFTNLEHHDIDVDETCIKFGYIQEDNPPTRRYSEPDINAVLRRKGIMSNPSSRANVAGSESGIDILRFPVEVRHETKSVIWPLTASMRSRFRPRNWDR